MNVGVGGWTHRGGTHLHSDFVVVFAPRGQPVLFAYKEAQRARELLTVQTSVIQLFVIMS